MVFARHPCFSFAGSMIVGLAIGKAKSRDADIASDFFNVFYKDADHLLELHDY